MRDLARGVWTLRLIATSAPLLGFFDTSIGVVGAFRGCSCSSPNQMLGIVAGGLAEGIEPTAAGLAIGILSYWVHSYSHGQLENLEMEMKCAALELFNQLSLAPSGRNISN